MNQTTEVTVTIGERTFHLDAYDAGSDNEYGVWGVTIKEVVRYVGDNVEETADWPSDEQLYRTAQTALFSAFDDVLEQVNDDIAESQAEEHALRWVR
jgi:hypothetical protein